MGAHDDIGHRTCPLHSSCRRPCTAEFVTHDTAYAPVCVLPSGAGWRRGRGPARAVPRLPPEGRTRCWGRSTGRPRCRSSGRSSPRWPGCRPRSPETLGLDTTVHARRSTFGERSPRVHAVVEGADGLAEGGADTRHARQLVRGAGGGRPVGTRDDGPGGAVPLLDQRGREVRLLAVTDCHAQRRDAARDAAQLCVGRAGHRRGGRDRPRPTVPLLNQRSRPGRRRGRSHGDAVRAARTGDTAERGGRGGGGRWRARHGPGSCRSTARSGCPNPGARQRHRKFAPTHETPLRRTLPESCGLATEDHRYPSYCEYEGAVRCAGRPGRHAEAGAGARHAVQHGGRRRLGQPLGDTRSRPWH